MSDDEKRELPTLELPRAITERRAEDSAREYDITQMANKLRQLALYVEIGSPVAFFYAKKKTDGKGYEVGFHNLSRRGARRLVEAVRAKISETEFEGGFDLGSEVSDVGEVNLIDE